MRHEGATRVQPAHPNLPMPPLPGDILRIGRSPRRGLLISVERERVKERFVIRPVAIQCLRIESCEVEQCVAGPRGDADPARPV